MPGIRSGGAKRRLPNPPMQSTPLRVHKIMAFLNLGISPTPSRSIGGGAADGQPVGRLRARSASLMTNPFLPYGCPGGGARPVSAYRKVIHLE